MTKTRVDFDKTQLYSEELGLDLESLHERDLFLWFLACLLFGHRISEDIARRTFHAFVAHRLTTPQKILAAGWDYLVNPIMRDGGYVRYDESESRRILSDCQLLLNRYDGKVGRIHEDAADGRDLEARLKEFDGVGPVTLEIFLREMQPFWPKSGLKPSAQMHELASRFGVDLDVYDHKSLRFARVQAGLIRSRHEKP